MKNKIIEYTRNLLNNTPDDWIKLTTHRLDIYDEKLAKNQFLNELGMQKAAAVMTLGQISPQHMITSD